jgi:hypothetical protein
VQCIMHRSSCLGGILLLCVGAWLGREYGGGMGSHFQENEQQLCSASLILSRVQLSVRSSSSMETQIIGDGDELNLTRPIEEEGEENNKKEPQQQHEQQPIAHLRITHIASIADQGVPVEPAHVFIDQVFKLYPGVTAVGREPPQPHPPQHSHQHCITFTNDRLQHSLQALLNIEDGLCYIQNKGTHYHLTRSRPNASSTTTSKLDKQDIWYELSHGDHIQFGKRITAVFEWLHILTSSQRPPHASSSKTHSSKSDTATLQFDDDAGGETHHAEATLAYDDANQPHTVASSSFLNKRRPHSRAAPAAEETQLFGDDDPAPHVVDAAQTQVYDGDEPALPRGPSRGQTNRGQTKQDDTATLVYDDGEAPAPSKRNADMGATLNYGEEEPIVPRGVDSTQSYDDDDDGVEEDADGSRRRRQGPAQAELPPTQVYDDDMLNLSHSHGSQDDAKPVSAPTKPAAVDKATQLFDDDDGAASDIEDLMGSPEQKEQVPPTTESKPVNQRRPDASPSGATAPSPHAAPSPVHASSTSPSRDVKIDPPRHVEAVDDDIPQAEAPSTKRRKRSDISAEQSSPAPEDEPPAKRRSVRAAAAKVTTPKRTAARSSQTPEQAPLADSVDTPQRATRKRKAPESPAKKAAAAEPPKTEPVVTPTRGGRRRTVKDHDSEDLAAKELDAVPTPPRKKAKTEATVTSTVKRGHVLLTSVSADKKQSYTKLVKELGWHIIEQDDPSAIAAATHVLISKDLAGPTLKLLQAISICHSLKFVLTTDWLDASKKAGQFLEETPFLLPIASPIRKTFGFTGDISAFTDKPRNKLFLGHTFYVSPSCASPPRDDMCRVIEAAGGSTTNHLPSSFSDTTVIIGCAEDADMLERPKLLGHRIYKFDFLKFSVMKQQLQWNNHQLEQVKGKGKK